MDHLKDIWTSVLEERRAQDEEHGGPEADDLKTQFHWVAYITKQLGPAVVDLTAGPLCAARKFRYQMVRVAALAVASIEWVDRVIEALEEEGEYDDDNAH